MEVWRKIDLDKTGKYEVSNLGRVRSLWRSNQYGHSKDNIHYLIPHLNSNYYRVGLTIDGKNSQHYIARLVAKAFPDICGEWFEGCEVNHKDEDTANNRADNLETCTPSYNSSYGTRTQRIREKMPSYGKPILQFTKKGEFLRKWDDIFEILNENPSYQYRHLLSVLRGEKHRHSAYNFVWKYGTERSPEEVLNILEEILNGDFGDEDTAGVN